jgi:hypothetical protein
MKCIDGEFKMYGSLQKYKTGIPGFPITVNTSQVEGINNLFKAVAQLDTRYWTSAQLFVTIIFTILNLFLAYFAFAVYFLKSSLYDIGKWDKENDTSQVLQVMLTNILFYFLLQFSLTITMLLYAANANMTYEYMSK